MSAIKLTADSGGGTVELKAPATTTSNAAVVFKLPVADGTSGQALTTNASGQLAFSSVAAGGSSNIAFNSGNGIDFSAAAGGGASSSILDEYEEGTFTPTARGNNTNSSPVISGSGKYTKIGRLVQCTLTFSAENGSYLPSGEYFQIHGLPYITDGTHIVPGPGMNYKVVFNEEYQYYFYIPNNGTLMWGYYNRSDLPYQPWGTDQWDNTQWYHENTFTYMTDT